MLSAAKTVDLSHPASIGRSYLSEIENSTMNVTIRGLVNMAGTLGYEVACVVAGTAGRTERR